MRQELSNFQLEKSTISLCTAVVVTSSTTKSQTPIAITWTNQLE
ncbi:unnamed protein product, partial [Rotaria sordida]